MNERDSQIESRSYTERITEIADQLREEMDGQSQKCFVINNAESNESLLVQQLYTTGLIPCDGSVEKVVVDSKLDKITSANILNVDIHTYYYPDLDFFARNRFNPLRSTFNFKDMDNYSSGRRFLFTGSFSKFDLTNIRDVFKFDYEVFEFSKRISSIQKEQVLLNERLLKDTQFFMLKCAGRELEEIIVRNYFPLLEQLVTELKYRSA